jgi:serine/threonine protein kinase
VVIGTPGFMSPEQATGAPVGTPSDVFSLGAVLAHAATGVEPFGTDSPVALLYRVVGEEPDLSAVPDELRGTIALCLAKDPARRPSPAALVALLTGGERPTEPVPAAVPTVAYTRSMSHRCRGTGGFREGRNPGGARRRSAGTHQRRRGPLPEHTFPTSVRSPPAEGEQRTP